MKKIAVFNHKGGVSKTTTTFHLGWALSNIGKKVILVDADSQCNLTLYALGFTKYANFYESGNQNNINDALKPAYKSEPNLIDAVDCLEIRDKLFLLPGHIDFSENEVQLGVSMQLGGTFGTMRNLPGAFNYLMKIIGAKYNADFILIDMNPSLSAINQDILFSSDFFLIPTSPDYFSIMSIKSLAKVLPNWERWAKTARSFFSDSTYPFEQSQTRFLGYTVNDFNLSTHGAKPSYTFQKIMQQISDEVKNSLIPALEQNDMLLMDEIYKQAYENMQNVSNKDNIKYFDYYCLAQISNFNKLIGLSNQKGIPVFELKETEINFKGQYGTLHWFKFLYNAFAKRILELTGN